MAGKKDTFGFDIERYKTNLDEEDEFPNDLNVEEEATGRENDDVELPSTNTDAQIKRRASSFASGPCSEPKVLSSREEISVQGSRKKKLIPVTLFKSAPILLQYKKQKLVITDDYKVFFENKSNYCRLAFVNTSSTTPINLYTQASGEDADALKEMFNAIPKASVPKHLVTCVTYMKSTGAISVRRPKFIHILSSARGGVLQVFNVVRDDDSQKAKGDLENEFYLCDDPAQWVGDPAVTADDQTLYRKPQWVFARNFASKSWLKILSLNPQHRVIITAFDSKCKEITLDLIIPLPGWADCVVRSANASDRYSMTRSCTRFLQLMGLLWNQEFPVLTPGSRTQEHLKKTKNKPIRFQVQQELCCKTMIANIAEIQAVTRDTLNPNNNEYLDYMIYTLLPELTMNICIPLSRDGVSMIAAQDVDRIFSATRDMLASNTIYPESLLSMPLPCKENFSNFILYCESALLSRHCKFPQKIVEMLTMVTLASDKTKEHLSRHAFSVLNIYLHILANPNSASTYTDRVAEMLSTSYPGLRALILSDPSQLRRILDAFEAEGEDSVAMAVEVGMQLLIKIFEASDSDCTEMLEQVFLPWVFNSFIPKSNSSCLLKMIVGTKTELQLFSKAFIVEKLNDDHILNTFLDQNLHLKSLMHFRLAFISDTTLQFLEMIFNTFSGAAERGSLKVKEEMTSKMFLQTTFDVYSTICDRVEHERGLDFFNSMNGMIFNVVFDLGISVIEQSPSILDQIFKCWTSLANVIRTAQEDCLQSVLLTVLSKVYENIFDKNGAELLCLNPRFSGRLFEFCAELTYDALTPSFGGALQNEKGLWTTVTDVNGALKIITQLCQHQTAVINLIENNFRKHFVRLIERFGQEEPKFHRLGFGLFRIHELLLPAFLGLCEASKATESRADLVRNFIRQDLLPKTTQIAAKLANEMLELSGALIKMIAGFVATPDVLIAFLEDSGDFIPNILKKVKPAHEATEAAYEEDTKTTVVYMKDIARLIYSLVNGVSPIQLNKRMSSEQRKAVEYCKDVISKDVTMGLLHVCLDTVNRSGIEGNAFSATERKRNALNDGEQVERGSPLATLCFDTLRKITASKHLGPDACEHICSFEGGIAIRSIVNIIRRATATQEEKDTLNLENVQTVELDRLLPFISSLFASICFSNSRQVVSWAIHSTNPIEVLLNVLRRDTHALVKDDVVDALRGMVMHDLEHRETLVAKRGTEVLLEQLKVGFPRMQASAATALSFVISGSGSRTIEFIRLKGLQIVTRLLQQRTHESKSYDFEESLHSNKTDLEKARAAIIHLLEESLVFTAAVEEEISTHPELLKSLFETFLKLCKVTTDRFDAFFQDSLFKCVAAAVTSIKISKHIQNIRWSRSEIESLIGISPEQAKISCVEALILGIRRYYETIKDNPSLRQLFSDKKALFVLQREAEKEYTLSDVADRASEAAPESFRGETTYLATTIQSETRLAIDHYVQSIMRESSGVAEMMGGRVSSIQLATVTHKTVIAAERDEGKFLTEEDFQQNTLRFSQLLDKLQPILMRAGQKEAQPSASKPFQVFISYNWDHKEQATWIKSWLSEQNISFWIDEDKMEGDLWAVYAAVSSILGDIYQSMAEGILASEVVLCLVSQRYQASANCQFELKFAQENKKYLIRINVDIESDRLLMNETGLILTGKKWFKAVSRQDFDACKADLLKLVRQVESKNAPPEYNSKVPTLASFANQASDSIATNHAGPTISQTEALGELDEDLQRVLDDLGLGEVAILLVNEAITSVDDVKDLSPEDFAQIKVKKGHAKKLLKALSIL